MSKIVWTRESIGQNKLILHISQYFTGNTHRFTIHPIFVSLRNSFWCHAKQQLHNVLYRMYYYIEIPDPKQPSTFVYVSPHRHVKVLWDDVLERTFNADYIRVHHDRSLLPPKELLLHGREYEARGKSGDLRFGVYPLKSDDSSRHRPVIVHQIADNILVATVDFAKPFQYTTKTWAGESTCNISLFGFRQKTIHRDRLKFRVHQTHGMHGAFRYRLVPQNRSPFISFAISGNICAY